MARRRARQALLCLALCAFAASAAAEELGASLAGLLVYAHEHNPELRMRSSGLCSWA